MQTSKPILAAFLCVILAASLGVQLVSPGGGAEERRSSVQILALGSPSATLQTNRGGPRIQDQKHRPGVFLLFFSAASHGPAQDSACLSTPIENFCSGSFSAVTSGRSPPLQFS
jgi:hypothetical protein